MGLKNKVEDIVIKMLDKENKEEIAKKLTEKVMKQLSPEIMQSVNKTLILNLEKWKKDFIEPLIKGAVKEYMEKEKK